MLTPSAGRRWLGHAGHRLRRRVRRALPGLAGCHHRTDAAGIALTFDDGPDPVFTPQVLDLLAEHGVRATFFLVGGRAQEHPGLVRRILDEGHRIGSHTWSHPDPAVCTGLAMVREVLRGKRAIERVGGVRVPLFRPVMGEVGWGVALGARLAGLQVWLWSVDPQDWQPGVTTVELRDRLGGLGPGDVVLLHDGLALARAPQALDRGATVAAVRHLLRDAAGQGLGVDLLPGPA